MTNQVEYVALIDGIEQTWRPTGRRVLRDLLRSPRHGIVNGAHEAEVAADRLAQVGPPDGLEHQHEQFIAALRAVAEAARTEASRPGWRRGKTMLGALRQSGALNDLAIARRELRQSLDSRNE